jgi:hypothetical protein
MPVNAASRKPGRAFPRRGRPRWRSTVGAWAGFPSAWTLLFAVLPPSPNPHDAQAGEYHRAYCLADHHISLKRCQTIPPMIPMTPKLRIPMAITNSMCIVLRFCIIAAFARAALVNLFAPA